MHDIFLLLIGGGIGFLSAIGVEATRWLKQKRDERREIRKLARMLFEEVEQIAEVLAIDLVINKNEKIELEYRHSGASWENKLQPLERISKMPKIFTAVQEKIIYLPGYTPNQLVRFYARLEVNLERMRNHASARSTFQWEEARKQSYVECENIKFCLNAIFKEKDFTTAWGRWRGG